MVCLSEGNQISGGLWDRLGQLDQEWKWEAWQRSLGGREGLFQPLRPGHQVGGPVGRIWPLSLFLPAGGTRGWGERIF